MIRRAHVLYLERYGDHILSLQRNRPYTATFPHNAARNHRRRVRSRGRPNLCIEQQGFDSRLRSRAAEILTNDSHVGDPVFRSAPHADHGIPIFDPDIYLHPLAGLQAYPSGG
jgi:hypothetical protein